MSSPEQELKSRSPQGRIFELDALRGLAAVVVIFHHFRFAINETQPSWYVRPIVAGHEAVMLFFVLSGYVLSLPTWRGKTLPYGKYIVRRIFRIYVPFFGALILATIGAAIFMGSKLPLSPWFHMTWQTPITLRLMFDQILMSPDPALNTAFWSLRYEMQMSIVFPLICAFLLRARLVGALMLVVASSLAAYFIHPFWLIPADIQMTLHYVFPFVLGAALAMKQEEIGWFWAKLAAPVKAAFALISVMLYYSMFAGLLRHLGLHSAETDGPVAIGAAGIIIVAHNTILSKALDTKIPEYLGRISYSTYLMHGTVLFTLLNLLYGKINTILLFAIYVPTVLIVSHIFCVLVEEPAMNLGKKLTGNKKPKSQPITA